MKKINARNLAFSFILIPLVALSIACSRPLGNDTSAAPGILAGSDNTTLIYSDGVTQLVENQAPMLPSIADVVAAVRPSVVTIDTEVTYSLFRRSFTQQGAGSQRAGYMDSVPLRGCFPDLCRWCHRSYIRWGNLNTHRPHGHNDNSDYC